MALIYIRNQNQQYVVELPAVPGAETYVGTESTCHVNLAGVPGVSPVHARIVCQPEGYVIEDLQSQYGTIMGGRPIVQPEYMMPGVEYVVGQAVLVLDLTAQQPQQPQQGQANPAAQTVQKPKLRSAAPKRTAGGVSGLKGGAPMASLPTTYSRASSGGSVVTVIFVLVLLAVAFYTGLALHHWERTGNFLPGIVADPEPEE